MLQQQYNSVTVKGLGKRIGKVSTAASLTLMGLMAQMPAWAAGALEGEVKKQPLNISAIIMFLIFVLATLGITYWASKQNKTASDFYTAGGGISGTKNGIAIAGDYMSAVTFVSDVLAWFNHSWCGNRWVWRLSSRSVTDYLRTCGLGRYHEARITCFPLQKRGFI